MLDYLVSFGLPAVEDSYDEKIYIMSATMDRLGLYIQIDLNEDSLELGPIVHLYGFAEDQLFSFCPLTESEDIRLYSALKKGLIPNCIISPLQKTILLVETQGIQGIIEMQHQLEPDNAKSRETPDQKGFLRGLNFKLRMVRELFEEKKAIKTSKSAAK